MPVNAYAKLTVAEAVSRSAVSRDRMSASPLTAHCRQVTDVPQGIPDERPPDERPPD